LTDGIRCDTYDKLKGRTHSWRDYDGPENVADDILRFIASRTPSDSIISFIHEETGQVEGIPEEDEGPSYPAPPLLQEPSEVVMAEDGPEVAVLGTEEMMGFDSSTGSLWDRELSEEEMEKLLLDIIESERHGAKGEQVEEEVRVSAPQRKRLKRVLEGDDEGL